MAVFANRTQTDRSPRKANETTFGFLDRTGSAYFEPVRDLLETWVDNVPTADRAGIVGNLTSEDDKFESALWELYLHAVTTGSADHVEIHPEVPGTCKHPDFLVHGEVPYYLEAVAVGRPPKQVAADRRLQEVEAILDEAPRIDGATLRFQYYAVGPRPVRAVKLRDQLVRWTTSLVTAGLALPADVFQAHAPRPTFRFEDDG